MPTKIVLHARGSGVSSLEEGTEATERLVLDRRPRRRQRAYFDGLDEGRANPQAYDPGRGGACANCPCG